ncbi:uncharacterized protein LOC135846917 [Planococcus citri]|uniref:uncharacterized protein LOC135846917 n=1 Tax=Planococcus citri TaxID=170843 RepID=UPI0031F8EA6F
MIEDMVFIFLLVMQPSTVLLKGSSIIPNHNSSATSETFFLDESYSLNDFEKVLIQHNNIFVDKTMFIVELINRIGKCELISRPSWWGKTFNMGMTASFFDIPHHEDGSVDEHKRNMVRSFFAGGAKVVLPSRESPIEMKPLKISKIESAMDEIGNHPTIFISFVNSGITYSYDEFIMNLAEQITTLIQERHYAAFLPKYCEFCYPDMCSILLNSTSEMLASSPLGTLSHSVEIMTCLLTRHFGSETVILIDEFDYPLNRMTYDSEDFNKTTDFLKSFIGWTFKGRPTTASDIYRGVITGVLQFSRVGVSAEMSVCCDCSVLQPHYSEHFGFTEEDIQTLYEKNPNFPHDLSQLKNWYDGYTFGESRLYNPLSIRRCFISWRVGSYWIESVPMDLSPRYGKNSLYEPFMVDLYQSRVQKLFVNVPVEVELVSEVAYKDVTKSLESFLSLLTSLGYLTYEKPSENHRFKVRIPNKEVRDFGFKQSINVWTMKYVCEESVIIRDILYEIYNGFTENDIATVQDSLSQLFSKINETAPADNHCDIVFGLLTQFDDKWDLQRSFKVITIYKQVTFQCSITLRLKFDNCYNINPIAINFILNGDSTMEQNITEAKHTGDIQKIIKDKVMDYSKKKVAELMEKSKIKAAELTEKCNFIWHTCIVVGKKILWMFPH